MNPRSRWKILTALFAIFILGGFAGAALKSAFDKEYVLPRVTETHWAARTLAEYSERLKLTPAQLDRLRPEMEKAESEMERVRQNTVLQLRTIIKTNSSSVMKELTPDQRAVFSSLIEERRERVRQEHGVPTEHTREP